MYVCVFGPPYEVNRTTQPFIPSENENALNVRYSSNYPANASESATNRARCAIEWRQLLVAVVVSSSKPPVCKFIALTILTTLNFVFVARYPWLTTTEVLPHRIEQRLNEEKKF